MRLARHEVAIHAPIEVVWAHLTTAEGLMRWVGPAASAEAVPGGALRWTHPDGSTVVGRFVELNPPHRLVFTYGWDGDLMGVPPESTTVEITLSETAGSTTLSLEHHGLAPAVADAHEQGWAYFLAVLSDVLAGRPPPTAARGY